MRDRSRWWGSLGLLSATLLVVGSNAADQKLPKFMGRQVTIIDQGRKDEFFPKGPASVCVEGPPQKQCYTAPEDFGNNPAVSVVPLNKGKSALFFTAASGGVSGFRIHFALLRPGAGKGLDNFLMSDAEVSNQSQNAFWTEPTISDAPVFVTANFVWGPDEVHYAPHRFIISGYVQKTGLLDGTYYYLEDQYMTTRKYDLDKDADILASEKKEILARLLRVKAESH